MLSEELILLFSLASNIENATFPSILSLHNSILFSHSLLISQVFALLKNYVPWLQLNKVFNLTIRETVYKVNANNIISID